MDIAQRQPQPTATGWGRDRAKKAAPTVRLPQCAPLRSSAHGSSIPSNSVRRPRARRPGLASLHHSSRIRLKWGITRPAWLGRKRQIRGISRWSRNCPSMLRWFRPALQSSVTLMNAMVVNQCLCRRVDGVFHGLQLLNNIRARSAIIQHRNPPAQVTPSLFQSVNDFGMAALDFFPASFISHHGGYVKQLHAASARAGNSGIPTQIRNAAYRSSECHAGWKRRRIGSGTRDHPGDGPSAMHVCPANEGPQQHHVWRPPSVESQRQPPVVPKPHWTAAGHHWCRPRALPAQLARTTPV